MFAVLIFFCLVIFGIKFLKLLESTVKPNLSHSGSYFIKNILSRCQSFNKEYHPPLLWGRSGHVQTVIYGKVGRWNCPFPSGRRFMFTFDSGETMTYDVFQPSKFHKFMDHCSLLICPGICNSSEKKYIRTFVQYAIDKGYQVFVLNHIGALSSVKLTSPKIFTYGETKYFARMVDEAKLQCPDSVFVAIGFSMGGNIVTRYLGEDSSRQKSFVCAISLCQGYHGIRSTEPLKYGYRRVYNYLMTINFKKVLQPHWKDLFHLKDNHLHKSLSMLFNEEKVKSATSLQDIEDGLLRHFDGFSSSHELKRHCGCEDAINNISLPFLLVNSEDDPLIVNEVHDIPARYCENNEQALFVRTKHGGHLGFFKGGWLVPHDTTLVEDYVMEYIEAVLDVKLFDGQLMCDNSHVNDFH